jgi:L,D-peptidoglycan transpeptidase YkuD (ErfK/YbiS/YcfS/YnhG family)
MKIFFLLTLSSCLACRAVLALAPASVLAQPVVAQSNPQQRLDSSMQLIVVTTPDWDAVEGTLQRYGRPEPGGPWNPVGGPVVIVVGKNGMGWDTGLVRTGGPGMASPLDPVKKEGDGKSPAGVFGFGTAFGDAARAPSGWNLPYTPLTPTVECVDDIHSRSYNKIVDRDTIRPDWDSSEHMLSVGQAYRWGAVIDYNSNPTVPSAGSCVFMHIWSGPRKGTAGCTAMPQMELEPILAWLDPSRAPVLVQLPTVQYERLRKGWHLPALAKP